MRAPLLLAVLLATCPAWAQTGSVTLHEPARDFGYFIGDVFAADAVITTEPGAELDTATLPAPGPVSTWVDLRRIAVSRDKAGRITIHGEYQSFYAPEDATRVQVPAYTLVFVRNGVRTEAHVPAWKFIASPLRHDLQPVIESSALKADHPYLMAPLEGVRMRLFIALAIAAFAAIVIARTQGLLPAMNLRAKPFAQAQRRIRRAAREDSEDSRRAVLLALHRAFDATDGQRVMADDIAPFLERHKQYGDLRGEIEAFFAASRAIFFGARPDAARLAPLGKLTALGRKLCRAERAA